MPKFLPDCHYNREEISRHLNIYIYILAGPNEWQQVAIGQILRKPVGVYEGADFSWLSSKVSPTLGGRAHLSLLAYLSNNYTTSEASGFVRGLVAGADRMIGLADTKLSYVSHHHSPVTVFPFTHWPWNLHGVIATLIIRVNNLSRCMI